MYSWAFNIRQLWNVDTVGAAHPVQLVDARLSEPGRAAVLFQNLHRRFVHLQDVVAELRFVHQIDQRCDQLRNTDHPRRHRRARDVDIAARENTRLPVQRQAVLEFRDSDVREQSRRRVTLGDRLRRHVSDGDRGAVVAGAFAGPARGLEPHMRAAPARAPE